MMDTGKDHIKDVDPMSVIESEPEWRLKLRKCRKCHELEEPLVFIGKEGIARPLFYEGGALDADILFVLEAPNRDDTFDPDKGRMTFGEETDPTGRFFEECLRNEVGIGIEQTMIVNSVLCLPALEDGKYPVRPEQVRLCSPNLKATIENVDPRVVVTLGVEALKALKLIESHSFVLREAVARRHDWFGRALFPLYHPGYWGQRTRKDYEQRADYNELRSLIKRQLG